MIILSYAVPLYLHIVEDIIEILIKFLAEFECEGLYVRNPKIITNCSTIDWVILDKTGTLTNNNYEVNCVCIKYMGFELNKYGILQ